jgi:hypothetical protein
LTGDDGVLLPGQRLILNVSFVPDFTVYRSERMLLLHVAGQVRLSPLSLSPSLC